MTLTCSICFVQNSKTSMSLLAIAAGIKQKESVNKIVKKVKYAEYFFAPIVYILAFC